MTFNYTNVKSIHQLNHVLTIITSNMGITKCSKKDFVLFMCTEKPEE